ncbi:MAG: hypothetical protein RJB34_2290 [Pseudomonadota bacterium]|jgi:hypothetical protein
MTSMGEIQQELKAFYRANGIDQLVGLVIVILTVISMMCAHALMGIAVEYGWVATILGSIFGSALFVLAVGWTLAAMLMGWLYFYRNKGQGRGEKR